MRIMRRHRGDASSGPGVTSCFEMVETVDERQTAVATARLTGRRRDRASTEPGVGKPIEAASTAAYLGEVCSAAATAAASASQ